MATFLLVHGSWQGAWCWREIVPRLKQRGHGATAIDLPGHGEDRSPPESITLEDYVDCVVHAVNSLKDAPILVGHCMGGFIGQVAELIPDRIAALVYVAALAPSHGCSMMQFVDGFDPRYLAQLNWSPDRRTAQISLEGAKESLYSCCSPEIVESAYARFTPEPVAPFETPISITERNFGRVRRYYIECLQDRVLPIALQRAIRDGVRFTDVYSLDTGHAPFFSAPQELAAILHIIAEKT